MGSRWGWTGVIGRMQEVWSDIVQEPANVPLADGVALRPQKKDALDLTSARIFLEKPEHPKRVVELLKEFYPTCTVEGKNVKGYTIVLSIIRSVAHLHRLWGKKTFLSDTEVACADQAAKQLGVCWSLMKWKPTLWLHWTVAHGGWVLRTYRSMYMFASVPTERRNSPFKTHLQSCFRGWSVRNPKISKRGTAHILEMYALDEGLTVLQKRGD